MWKGYYGKEPFNLRLTVLRMLNWLPLIAAVTLLGTAVFGGGYYVKNVLLRGQRYYEATSFYRVDYAVDDVEDMMDVFINEMSWNTYMQSAMFQDAVQAHLAEAGVTGVSDQELAESIKAFVLSDVRVPSTTVTTDSPEKSVSIARAVEAAMTGEIAEGISELAAVTVIEPGQEAKEVLPNIRVGRAFVFSAVMSSFFVVIILLLKETGDDGLWLPESLRKRYGLKAAGTLRSPELAENLGYFFREAGTADAPAGKIAVCPVQEKLDAQKVLEQLREVCPDVVGEGWFGVNSPLADPKVCRQLREAGGILLAVRAGGAGRTLEQVLDYLEQQDCHVTAAILWDADEKLLRRYRFCGK